MQVPRPLESSFPDVRVPTQAPAEAFGGGESAARASGAARQFAQDQAALHQQHLEQALQTEVNANLSRLVDEETRHKVALQQVKGKDALAAGSKAVEDYGKFYQDLEKNTANPMVKMATRQHFERSRSNLSGWTQDYGNKQYQQYQDDTDQATIKSERNAAIADGRPERINQALASQMLSIENMGKRHGWDQKTVDLRVAEAKSATHYGVLSVMATAGDDLAAKAYFTAHKSEFVGDDLIHATARVQRDSLLGEATRYTDALFTDREDWIGPPGEVRAEQYRAPESMEDVRKETSKIERPELRAEVERQAKIRLAERKSDAIAAYASKLEEAQDIVERTGNTKGLPAGLRTTHIRELERRAFEIRAGEKKVMTDTLWSEFNSYLDLAADPETREQFLAIHPVDYRNKFPDAQYNELRDMRTALLKDDKKALGKLESHRTDTDFIDYGLSRLELVARPGARLSGDALQNKEMFERIAREQFTFYTVKNQGKPLDNEVRGKIIDKLVEDVVTEEHWYGNVKRRGYKVLDADYTRRITQMEAGEQILIEEALRRAGEPVTRGRVLEVYMNSQRKRK